MPSTATVDGPLARFRSGMVIPAQPLALTADLELDVPRQRTLTRYYLAAGAGGVAVGVHTTQFAIHFEHVRLLEPVLATAADVVREAGDPDVLLVAGACGSTAQAVAEAHLARKLGYHAVLLAPFGAADLDEHQLIERTRAVGEVLPVIGFYLQPAVGGRILGRDYWRRLAEIDSVIGIKVAPFDRYATLDVFAGVAESARRDDIALYTGNDDHIIGDLLMQYPTPEGRPLEFVGGLLGQWSVWTREAVRVLELCRQAKGGDVRAWAELRALDLPLTEANSAIFDAANGFRDCLPGIHEVLRRQGLLDGLWCLDPHEHLTDPQREAIDHVLERYPELQDNDFIAEHHSTWREVADYR